MKLQGSSTTKNLIRKNIRRSVYRCRTLTTVQTRQTPLGSTRSHPNSTSNSCRMVLRRVLEWQPHMSYHFPNHLPTRNYEDLGFSYMHAPRLFDLVFMTSRTNVELADSRDRVWCELIQHLSPGHTCIQPQFDGTEPGKAVLHSEQRYMASVRLVKRLCYVA